MKRTKTHRVLYWMKKYIDFNTEKRTNAANSFGKDFFKLMINFCLWEDNGKFKKKIQYHTTKQ